MAWVTDAKLEGAEAAEGAYRAEAGGMSHLLIPTTVRVASGPWKLTRVVFPPGKDAKFSFADKPLSVYEGTVLIGAEVLATASRAGATPLRLELCWTELRSMAGPTKSGISNSRSSIG